MINNQWLGKHILMCGQGGIPYLRATFSISWTTGIIGSNLQTQTSKQLKKHLQNIYEGKTCLYCHWKLSMHVELFLYQWDYRSGNRWGSKLGTLLLIFWARKCKIKKTKTKKFHICSLCYNFHNSYSMVSYNSFN